MQNSNRTCICKKLQGHYISNWNQRRQLLTESALNVADFGFTPLTHHIVLTLYKYFVVYKIKLQYDRQHTNSYMGKHTFATLVHKAEI